MTERDTLEQRAEQTLTGIRCGDAGCAVCPECEGERIKRIVSALKDAREEGRREAESK